MLHTAGVDCAVVHLPFVFRRSFYKEICPWITAIDDSYIKISKDMDIINGKFVGIEFIQADCHIERILGLCMTRKSCFKNKGHLNVETRLVFADF